MSYRQNMYRELEAITGLTQQEIDEAVSRIKANQPTQEELDAAIGGLEVAAKAIREAYEHRLQQLEQEKA